MKSLFKLTIVILLSVFSFNIAKADGSNNAIDAVNQLVIKKEADKVSENSDSPYYWKPKVYGGAGIVANDSGEKDIDNCGYSFFGGVEFRFQHDTRKRDNFKYESNSGYFITFEGDYFYSNNGFNNTKQIFEASEFLIRDRILENDFVKNIPFSARRIAGGAILFGPQVNGLDSSGRLTLGGAIYGMLGVSYNRIAYASSSAEQLYFDEQGNLVDTKSVIEYKDINGLAFEPGLGLKMIVGRFFFDIRAYWSFFFNSREFNINRYAEAYYADGTTGIIDLQNNFTDLYSKLNDKTSKTNVFFAFKASIGLYLF